MTGRDASSSASSVRARRTSSSTGSSTPCCLASHHSLGLQIADLVVASTLAARRGQGDASRWHKQLLPLFATHPDTKAVRGVGLVEFPARAKGEAPPPSKLFTT